MDEPYATTLATVAAGRAASVAELRRLAGRLEELPLDAVAEVLVLLALTTKPPRLQASDGYRAGCVSSQLSYTRKSEVAARLSRVNQWPRVGRPIPVSMRSRSRTVGPSTLGRLAQWESLAGGWCTGASIEKEIHPHGHTKVR
jgi:hypothetical protein